MQEHISNPASERAILGGIFSYGSDAFIDVDDIIDIKSFTIEENQILYACLKKVLETSSSVDLPSVLSAASSLGFESAFDKKISTNHVRSITNLDIDLENVRHHAVKIKKLEIARDIRSRAKRVQADISDVSGDESIDELISIGETPFFELSAALNDSVDDRPVTLGEEIDEYISHLEENPCEMLGLSSGFTRFDTAIGGGFRRKCVDLIAARPKTGKSMLADNFAMHFAGNLGVPVVMLDSEMS